MTNRNTFKCEYAFPILKTSEIIKNLNEMEINCKDEDINKPNYSKMEYIYENILDIILNLSNIL